MSEKAISVSTGSKIRTTSADLGFPIFLTAYDPSDLPGSSLDPMGFERKYLFLSDKILPGLTNVADRPRYSSILCAGAFLAEVNPANPPRSQYQKRLDHILRLERCTAPGVALAGHSATEVCGSEAWE